MNNHNRWRIGALASAIALLGSLASVPAHALALGRIKVQSALGEPLRAEIDMADMTADDALNLQVGVASAQSFKAAGLEYTAAVTGVEVRLQRRPDGRPYLRLSSSRAMNEPFVDLIVETNGSSGRMTRDYTMLFDPPRVRAAAVPIEPSAALTSRTPAPTFASAEAAPSPVREAISVRASPVLPPVNRPAPPARAPIARTANPETESAGGRQVVVKPGDTASAIAARNKPASVSLDQMLAAMLRSSPDAFVGGNINVVKSGAVLNIPGDDALGIRPGEARTLVAQSKDFNNFRRKLADAAPEAQVGAAERQAGGKVQASVDDRAAKPAAPDKLTLSGGAVGAKAPIANGSPATLSTGATLPPPASAAPVGTSERPPSIATGVAAVSPSVSTAVIAPAIATPAAVLTPPAAGLEAAASIASLPASAAVTGVAPSVPAPLEKPVVVAPIEPVPTSLIDEALDNPPILWGAGALLLLLGGLLFARYRHNKHKAHVNSSFLESRVQLDSFFGASGGQRIDTQASSAAPGTSTAYSPSQFDHAGDVDPVAEADVYLAYGRDQQAEEILKEAVRSHPTRVAVFAKLLEIYAKRRDSKAFDSIALEAFRLTQGAGDEWAHITRMGRELNPGNQMYRPRTAAEESAANSGASSTAPAAEAAPVPVAAAVALAAVGSHAPQQEVLPSQTAPTEFLDSRLGTPSAFLGDLDLDLDLDIQSAPAPLGDLPQVPASASASASATPSAPQPDLSPQGLDFHPGAFVKPQASQPAARPQAAHSGMLEFDLSSLSLDLDSASPPPASGLDEATDGPLETKFLLAEEFRILGDSEGARTLADEVLAKSKGPLKVKAREFLNTLS